MLNLITIDEFKNYKNINSEQYDPIINSLIGSVTSFIKGYTNRDLIDYSLTDKVEYFDATNYSEIYPVEFPLLEVTELAVSTDGGVTYTALVENTDYFVDEENDRIIANTGLQGFVSSTIRHKSGKLTYKGGYINTPLDLKNAAMDLVQYYKAEEHQPSKSMASANMDNPVGISPGSQLPPHIKRVLDLYRVL